MAIRAGLRGAAVASLCVAVVVTGCGRDDSTGTASGEVGSSSKSGTAAPPRLPDACRLLSPAAVGRVVGVGVEQVAHGWNGRHSHCRWYRPSSGTGGGFPDAYLDLLFGDAATYATSHAEGMPVRMARVKGADQAWIVLREDEAFAVYLAVASRRGVVYAASLVRPARAGTKQMTLQLLTKALVAGA